MNGFCPANGDAWEMVADHVSSVGIALIEMPATSPTYALTQTVTRFPTAALETALLDQAQQLIPLIKIQPLEPGYPAIYVSDRRCTVGGRLYPARLLAFEGIEQLMGGEADEATFTFGNADRVMRDLANDVDLYRASVEFSLYHVGTAIKLDLWKGDVTDWSLDAGPEFKVMAADGLYELNLPYPTRKISRTCNKVFNDGLACPYTSEGALDSGHFPNASASACDKGYYMPNGCLAHGMKRRFGGAIVDPQTCPDASGTLKGTTGDRRGHACSAGHRYSRTGLRCHGRPPRRCGRSTWGRRQTAPWSAG